MSNAQLDLSILQDLGIDKMPFGNNIIVTGPVGIGKSIFLNNILTKCLKNKKHIIYVALNDAPKEVKKRTSSLEGTDYTNLELLTFIDGYSWLLGEVNEKYHLSHISNLNDLGVKIFNAINEPHDHNILFCDSISNLFIYNAESEIIRFMQINMARVKQSESIGFWAVEEGIHTASFYNFIRHMADGVIEMRFEEGQELNRSIRIHTLKGLAHKTDWLPFYIEKGGEFVIKIENILAI